MKRTIAIVIFDRVEELERVVRKGVESFPGPPYADVPMPAFD